MSHHTAASQLTARHTPPLWARLYYGLASWEEDPKVCSQMQQMLLSHGVATTQSFPWQMENGLWLSISPLEGTVSYPTVGWTCFTAGRWESHIEHCLEEWLRPGETAIDIGANLGYFAALMARRVGPDGKVYAFEPAPSTFRRLTDCCALNTLSWLFPRAEAIGQEEGTAELFFYAKSTGNASLYKDRIDRLSRPQKVPIRTLDALLEAEEINPPQWLKLDIEGHEMAALRGGRNLLKKHRPSIIVELNERMARLGSWGPSDLANFLETCGTYRFFLIRDADLEPVDLETYEPERNRCVDLLALGPHHRN